MLFGSNFFKEIFHKGAHTAKWKYRKSSHRTEKWEHKNSVLWEIRLMRGIHIFFTEKFFQIANWNINDYSVIAVLKIWPNTSLAVFWLIDLQYYREDISLMRGISIFQKPSYREIRPMRGRLMRGLPVVEFSLL